MTQRANVIEIIARQVRVARRKGDTRPIGLKVAEILDGRPGLAEIIDRHGWDWKRLVNAIERATGEEGWDGGWH